MSQLTVSHDEITIYEISSDGVKWRMVSESEYNLFNNGHRKTKLISIPVLPGQSTLYPDGTLYSDPAGRLLRVYEGIWTVIGWPSGIEEDPSVAEEKYAGFTEVYQAGEEFRETQAKERIKSSITYRTSRPIKVIWKGQVKKGTLTYIDGDGNTY